MHERQWWWQVPLVPEMIRVTLAMYRHRQLLQLVPMASLTETNRIQLHPLRARNILVDGNVKSNRASV